MFDTHCHLNFSIFQNKVGVMIKEARKVGVSYFLVPGTDFETSKKAVEIAEKFDGVYAAVGIHPHHIMEIKNQKLKIKNYNLKSKVEEIEKLLFHPKAITVGEIGLDRYIYQKTKYKNYQVDNEFINLQKWFFIEQLKLAKKYKKAVIVHNRRAKKDLLEVLLKIENWNLKINKMVFHCCEPDDDLLVFAQKHKIFIGVDGDIVYNQKKQEFIKKVSLELLVLETDSPFLSPQKTFPNEPKNLLLIAEFVAKLKNVSVEQLTRITTKNAIKLFNLK